MSQAEKLSAWSRDDAGQNPESRNGFSRRSLLKTALGAAVAATAAGVLGDLDARAQEQGPSGPHIAQSDWRNLTC